MKSFEVSIIYYYTHSEHKQETTKFKIFILISFIDFFCFSFILFLCETTNFSAIENGLFVQAKERLAKEKLI